MKIKHILIIALALSLSLTLTSCKRYNKDFSEIGTPPTLQEVEEPATNIPFIDDETETENETKTNTEEEQVLDIETEELNSDDEEKEVVTESTEEEEVKELIDEDQTNNEKESESEMPEIETENIEEDVESVETNETNETNENNETNEANEATEPTEAANTDVDVNLNLDVEVVIPPVIEETPELPEEIKTVPEVPEGINELIANLIKASMNVKNLENYVVIIDGDDVVNTTNFFFNSKQLNKAMSHDANLSLITKSETLSTKAVTKPSHSEWIVEASNAFNEKGKLHFIMVNEEWKLNISDIIVSGTFEVPGDVNVFMNQKEVSKDFIKYHGKFDVYKLPWLLKDIENELTYKTEFGEYSGKFVGGNENTIAFRYQLTDENIASLIYNVEYLWKGLKQAADYQDIYTLKSLLSDKADITAEQVMTSLGEDINVDVFFDSFTKDTSATCHMTSSNMFRLYLIANFMVFKDIDYVTISVPCWVEIEKDGSNLKVVNASTEVWMSKIETLLKQI